MAFELLNAKNQNNCYVYIHWKFYLYIVRYEDIPGELGIEGFSPAESFEKANKASGKFGGVAGVFAGVIWKTQVF